MPSALSSSSWDMSSTKSRVCGGNLAPVMPQEVSGPVANPSSPRRCQLGFLHASQLIQHGPELLGGAERSGRAHQELQARAARHGAGHRGRGMQSQPLPPANSGWLHAHGHVLTTNLRNWEPHQNVAVSKIQRLCCVGRGGKQSKPCLPHARQMQMCWSHPI